MTERISQLIYRKLIGVITPAEEAELQTWTDRHPDNRRLVEALSDAEHMDSALKAARNIDCRRPADDMLRRIRVIHSRRLHRITAIAAFLTLIVGIGLYLFSHFNSSSTTSPSLASANIHERLDDIRPGSTKAMLSSTAGSTVELLSAQSGHNARTLSPQSASQHTNVHDIDTTHYCLDVPRGGEFKIVLEDSTEVWLNSQSQLRYPATFAAGERRIQLSGEAYLRVSPDSERPFYIESRGQEVRVYGTAFNIKAYDDEELVYTTLESGSISLRPISTPGGEIILSPGHQALFDSHNEKIDMRVVKPEIITGWRNGRFVFEEQKLESIMRDLSRWYDFDYEFADSKARDIIFLGSIPRYADFTTAIAILQSSGGLKFSLSNNKVIISSSH